MQSLRSYRKVLLSNKSFPNHEPSVYLLHEFYKSPLQRQRNCNCACAGKAFGTLSINEQTPPILIVGGGPVGIFTALLLSCMKIPSILVEKTSAGGDRAVLRDKSGRSIPPHPRAHVLHTRSMELIRQVGLEKDIWEQTPPCDHWKHFRYCCSLMGDTLAKIDHFSTNDFAMLRQASPCRVSQFSQPLLETVLYNRLLEEIKSTQLCQLLFDHEFETVSTKNNEVLEVVVTKRCKEKGSASDSILFQCSHIVAADGAYSNVRRDIGISISGERDLETFASIHFSSTELGEKLISTENGAMLSFVFNEETIAVVVAHDMRKGDWVIHVPFFPPIQSAKDFENEDVAKKIIRACLGTLSEDEISFELHSVRAWGMHATRADSFSGLDNRVFLVGDSAHQFPPSGGFGVNAGLADAHNLACKLAFVKHGFAPNSYLSTYDLERRPVVEEAIQIAVDNYRRGLIPAKVLGLDRGALSSAMSIINTISPSLSGIEKLYPVTRHEADPSIVSKMLFNSLLKVGRFHLNGYTTGESIMDKRFVLNKFYDYEKAKQRLTDVVVHREEALPLLFPHIDIGFKYLMDPTSSETSRQTVSKQGDNILSWASPPYHRTRRETTANGRIRFSLKPGCIIPHVYLKETRTNSNVSSLDLCNLGTSFVFIASDVNLITLMRFEMKKREMQKSYKEFMINSFLVVPASKEKNTVDIQEFDISSVLLDTSGEWQALCDEWNVSGILVRPDQHIQMVVTDESDLISKIHQLTF